MAWPTPCLQLQVFWVTAYPQTANLDWEHVCLCSGCYMVAIVCSPASRSSWWLLSEGNKVNPEVEFSSETQTTKSKGLYRWWCLMSSSCSQWWSGQYIKWVGEPLVIMCRHLVEILLDSGVSLRSVMRLRQLDHLWAQVSWPTSWIPL